MDRRSFINLGGSVMLLGGFAGCLSERDPSAEVDYDTEYAGKVVGVVAEYKGELGMGIYVQQPLSIAVAPPWISEEQFNEWTFQEKRDYVYETNEGIWFIGESSSVSNWEDSIEDAHSGMFGKYEQYRVVDRGELSSGDVCRLYYIDSNEVLQVGTIELIVP